jgi:hypothetical protein
MAGTKVSALTAAANFLLADELPVNEAGTTKKVTGTQIQTLLRGATPVQFQPGNPASRTGAAVMMGLGATCVFTPKFTRISVLFTGDGANATLLDGLTIQGYYGTGAAPVNAAAVSGTAFSVAKTLTSATASAKMGFALQGIITGLTPNTAYWFDCAVGNVTGGAASIFDIDFTAQEI